MKNKKTAVFVILTAFVIFLIYLLDYKSKINHAENETALVLNEDPSQITFIRVTKPNLKIGLQRNNEKNWELVEPIQDEADNFKIEELLRQFTSERQIAVAKKSDTDFSDEDLKEFGLLEPAIEFSFKNMSGQSKRISVGTQKNFEGYGYIRINSDNKILLVNPIWHEKSNYGLINYREKKLYRGSLSSLVKVKVKSIRDTFELNKINDRWEIEKKDIDLDQNRIREVLKKISESNIDEYVFEGEPSTKLIREKGLDKNLVSLELHTQNTFWSVVLNIKENEKTLYALTERPTYLVKLEPAAWETIGNLNVDDLRDRKAPLAFNLKEVKNIYFKSNDKEMNLILDGKKWISKIKTNFPNEEVNHEQVAKLLNQISDLKVTDFIEDAALKSRFEGKNILILRSENHKLLLQLNWGPDFKMKKVGAYKDYYFARTHLYSETFAIDKTDIERLDFDKIFSKSPAKQTEQSQLKLGGQDG